MARCPFAVWKPIPENAYQAGIQPTQIIVHSAVDAPGSTSLYGYFSRSDVTVETHFFIQNDGRIEEYLDTEVRGDGNRYANVRAVSIETEDDGDPNNRRWTPQQVQSLKRLIAWLWLVHPAIEKRMCPSWELPGVGYHTMWGAPSPWTPVQKTCPGIIRKLQWAQEIEPWIRAMAQGVPQAPEVDDEDDDMMTLVKCFDNTRLTWLLVSGDSYIELTKVPKGQYKTVELGEVDYRSMRDRLDLAEGRLNELNWRVQALVEQGKAA